MKIKLDYSDDNCSRRLSNLTFGSFLPALCQIINKDEEQTNADSDSQSSMNLKPYGNQISDTHLAKHRFQFSKVSARTLQVPTKEAPMNRSMQHGISMLYVPPSRNRGKVSINIELEDIRDHEEYWNNALIGLVVRDTPYMKFMEALVQQT
ncbi:hypothetical protein HAX54_018850 [Datura stramonium]|uniref:Uncharacterized protein n=1 Tax=Datura stramonium TaxID=4076 RepID=A0ABS8RJW8_DATST|nr:hypothetical protein [Datura stramonium]